MQQSGYGHCLWNKPSDAHVLCPSIFSCAILGKLPNLSVSLSLFIHNLEVTTVMLRTVSPYNTCYLNVCCCVKIQFNRIISVKFTSHVFSEDV